MVQTLSLADYNKKLGVIKQINATGGSSVSNFQANSKALKTLNKTLVQTPIIQSSSKISNIPSYMDVKANLGQGQSILPPSPTLQNKDIQKPKTLNYGVIDTNYTYDNSNYNSGGSPPTLANANNKKVYVGNSEDVYKYLTSKGITGANAISEAITISNTIDPIALHKLVSPNSNFSFTNIEKTPQGETINYDMVFNPASVPSGLLDSKKDNIISDFFNFDNLKDYTNEVLDKGKNILLIALGGIALFSLIKK